MNRLIQKPVRACYATANLGARRVFLRITYPTIFGPATTFNFGRAPGGSEARGLGSLGAFTRSCSQREAKPVPERRTARRIRGTGFVRLPAFSLAPRNPQK